jgi:hypothetical protein
VWLRLLRWCVMFVDDMCRGGRCDARIMWLCVLCGDVWRCVVHVVWLRRYGDDDDDDIVVLSVTMCVVRAICCVCDTDDGDDAT